MFAFIAFVKLRDQQKVSKKSLNETINFKVLERLRFLFFFTQNYFSILFLLSLEIWFFFVFSIFSGFLHQSILNFIMRALLQLRFRKFNSLDSTNDIRHICITSFLVCIDNLLYFLELLIIV